MDYGTPLEDGCKAVAGGAGDVFSREWTKATVSYDCGAMKAAIKMRR